MNKGLHTLVEKLRQEQEFVSFYKQQIRQSVQELNNSCDQVFHSLWLSHTLSYGLHRVLTHNSHTYEWSHALSHAHSVKFVNASKAFKSHLFVDRYSKFLTRLLGDPQLLSEVLNCVETEGLDCAWVVNDIMATIYGHCMFRRDHAQYLELMRELLRQHIAKCDSPRDLFGGVESVFNHVLSEYCSQLVELRTYLSLVLHDPIMQALACEEYLEFDVTKAGSRFQSSSEQNGLVGSGAFLFNEDLDVSCKKLAKLASQFLENLVCMGSQFPISLRWLLGSLKSMVRQKWPHIQAVDLRRPISDAIFSSILSSAVVNPDSFGVVDPSIIISEVGRYNLTQIMSVLQGCVWIMGKPSGAKYPIQKVVRRMDVNLFFSLVDNIDSGLTGAMPDLPSFLPGLRRSAFLASTQQLDNLVGLVAMLVTHREGKGKFHSNISNLLACLLPAMIEQACRNPYPITTKSALLHSPPPTTSSSSTTAGGGDSSDKIKSLGRKRGGKKSTMGSMEMLLDTGGGAGSQAPLRGRGMTTQHHHHNLTPERGSKGGSGGGGGSDKHLRRSQSSDAGFSMQPAGAGLRGGFHLPEQVLVLPVLESPGQSQEEGVAQWDFYLLTEEEFMASPSPGPKPDEQSYFQSFVRSQSIPRKLDLNAAAASATPPMMAAGLRDTPQAEEQVESIVRSNFAARGRVQSMISAIEHEVRRGRASTLPLPVTTATATAAAADGEGSKNGHTHSHTPPMSSTAAALTSSRSAGGSPVRPWSGIGGGVGGVGRNRNGHSASLECSKDDDSDNDDSNSNNICNSMSNSKNTKTRPSPPAESRGVGVAYRGTVVSQQQQQQQQSRLLEPRKLSTTFEASVEESVSYVKLHPPALENGVLLEEGREEGEEGGGGGGGGKESIRTEEVFVSVVPDEVAKEGSCERAGSQRTTGEFSDSSPPPLETSDELERPATATGTPSRQMDNASNSSLTNLYHQGREGEEEGEGEVEERVVGELPSTGKKKKKKWKQLFKKRKSSEEHESPKAGRSQSDILSTGTPHGKRLVFEGEGEGQEEVGNAEAAGGGGEGRGGVVKLRSTSDNMFLSGGGRRKAENRYTMYMQAYSAKLERSKVMSPKQEVEEEEEEVGEGEEGRITASRGSGLDQVDRGSTEDMLERLGHATPPAEMTPVTFKQSLFCNQLKYKLRSALQNIHVPLSLSPAFQHLHLSDGLRVDARYQLILLIQHALQRTQWAQNDMETALLTEILRMVEPLPSELIQVAIEGVLEEYHNRSSYIAYLVCSQQKFQDARLQVATVQKAIKRIMHINTELFINFAVRTFLEAPGQPRLSQLRNFSQQMETLFLPDEKCSLMTQCLAQFKNSLSEDSITWEHWQDRDAVFSCLSDYLFTTIHPHIFYPNGATSKEVDKIFSDHLATLSNTITMTHQSLQIPFVYHSGCPWVAAQKQLKTMGAYKSPRGKLHCIVQSLRILISLLQYARCGDPPGADDLFPVLVYVLIKANPPAMLSTCQYIRNFAENSLQGEDAYWWTQFSTAIEFTKTLS